MNFFGKKLFGKDLFGYKKPAVPMYDFAQHGLLSTSTMGYAGINELVRFEDQLSSAKTEKKKRGRPKKVAPKPAELTPKELFKLNTLNDNDFRIKADRKYVLEQLEGVEYKLSILGKKPKEKKNRYGDAVGGEWGAVRFGRDELESIQERLMNRLRINEFKKVLEDYPHTSSQKIAECLEKHSHLKADKAEQFVPDFPKQAIDAMKEYNDMCYKLSGKKAIFYVIAKASDFKQVAKRRDPILLAQSPFGHFWQILGAWDEEMIFLGDL